MKNLGERVPILNEMQKGEEVIWVNPDKVSFAESMEGCELSMADVEDAEERLKRFAPFIMKCFPETKDRNGLIESVLTDIPTMKDVINRKYGSHLEGRLLLKQDSHLAIAGSVKARGGIYEILKHTEDLAMEQGMLSLEDDYSCLAEPKFREFFAQYTVQVGSTGNLGMSIGIMSAAIGYQVIVHMSADAKQWKKDLLRSHGVTVIEYDSDYSEAVKNGRRLSDENPRSYFVDDENSRTLFLGYAVAAKRLVGQLEEKGIAIDEGHPLFVYIPCGVGGAPGGISFGLKQVFRDHVHCFFVEPTQAPCMLLGMATGLNSEISVQDIGLSGMTHADGLAVGRPSGFVGGVMKPMLSGEFTVQDAKLYDYMRDLLEAEDIFLEPSACAAFQGVIKLGQSDDMQRYLKENNLTEKMQSAVHIAWATGGSLVPEKIREEYKKTYLD
ncbi:MAG: D-serine ammonia-lyase [Eubacteriales bacterium]|nr:D-serine ammonia-lyase [Eubacteriales bacterium]